jgi:dTMP kinase
MFITFEGIDGSGKTTQITQVTDYLRQAGYTVLLTREPGGTAIGDQVREVLHRLDNIAMHPHTELLLYCASRAQIVAEVIRPALDQGQIVISDRYGDSTLAYQGYGHGLELAALKQILAFATGGLQPDVTVYLDLSPEAGLKRRQAGSMFGEEWNRLDDMALSFHQKVYAGYEKLIEAEPQRWLRIAGDQPADQVQAAIRRALAPRLPKIRKSDGGN